MRKPDKPCIACGTNDWWQRQDGGWCCNKCHPNPNKQKGDNGGEAGRDKESTSLEVIALLDRVRTGNDKLWNAWRQIRDIGDKDEKERQYDRWHEAKDKLNLLAKELVAKGFRDCLYMENGKKIRGCLYNKDNPEWFCNTCPAQLGKGPSYWEDELMSLPSPKVKESRRDEFIKKLGGSE